MKTPARIGIGQINCTVGDISGNCEKMIEYIGRAGSMGVEILSFPELSITGYPPEDLLLRESFIDDNIAAIGKVARTVKEMAVIAGFADRSGKGLYNAAAIMHKGRVVKIYHKIFLPNYGVFDEKRYFRNGTKAAVFGLGRIIFGVNICEDIWHKDGPVKLQARSGAGFIINISSSPFYAGKAKERENILKKSARDNGIVISYANMVGGQDELIFDGRSMVIDKKGIIKGTAAAFKEDLLVLDIDVPLYKVGRGAKITALSAPSRAASRPGISRKGLCRDLDPAAEIYQALVLGLADYAGKNGFEKVVLGLSGGIDSSLVAALAVDAIGKGNVTGVFMPTHYTSPESEKDAHALADSLGIKFINIPIEPIFKLYLMTLEQHFSGRARDIAEENLQARIRGNILMALSNKFGWLVLTTGNKSEISTGYATLYGDMAGGFAVIKDVSKMLVYKLARWRNSSRRVIPENVFRKEPNAELKHGQKDSDTLPPYEKLDPILKSYIEEDMGIKDIISGGLAKDSVRKVLNMVDRSEYKRRQAPPGVKITPKAFGRDRRMPITNRYRY